MAQISLTYDLMVNWAQVPSTDNVSPYACDVEWSLNVDRMLQSGFKARAVESWLPDLIGPASAQGSNSGYMH
jgi:hypothetical protein